jgi:mono/diheme cytochrome c family protein
MLNRLALPLLIAGLALPAGVAAQDTLLTVPRPAQVNDSAVARGRELFHGSANCSACHGPAGVGTDSGAALAQGIWMHGEDSYEGILSRVVHGIPKDLSTRNTAMPMRGWSTLTDSEARDVAAYVWTISHAWHRPAKPRTHS